MVAPFHVEAEGPFGKGLIDTWESSDLWGPLSLREVVLHLSARICFPQHCEIKTVVTGWEATVRAAGMHTSPVLAWFSPFPSTRASLYLIHWDWQTKMLFRVIAELMWQKQSCLFFSKTSFFSPVTRYSSKEENHLSSQKVNPETIENFSSQLIILGVGTKPSSGQSKMRGWLEKFAERTFPEEISVSLLSSGRGSPFSTRSCFIHIWSLELCGSHFVTMRSQSKAPVLRMVESNS